MSDSAICTSCRKPKAELKQRPSEVRPGLIMYICNDCIANKREPRGYIVLAGRELLGRGEGLEKISFWIKPKRYCGEEIKLAELQ